MCFPSTPGRMALVVVVTVMIAALNGSAPHKPQLLGFAAIGFAARDSSDQSCDSLPMGNEAAASCSSNRPKLFGPATAS